MSYQVRIKKFATKPAGAFKFNPLNWRRHGEAQRAALRLMLGDVGWVQGVIENRRTGNLIDGHARVEEALRIGPDQPVPYSIVDLSPAEERAVLATLDPIAAMADTDPIACARLYQETIAGLPRLEGLLLALRGGTNGHGAGAGGEDLRDANVGLERAAELKKKWRVKPGDLWRVGHHRILCGDATDARHVARVLDGGRPALMITDPLYGVDYDSTWRADTVNQTGDLAGEVYDPFVGSGTTMVAAENLKRRCYALEIDPGFVAVTLERMRAAFPGLEIAKLRP